MMSYADDEHRAALTTIVALLLDRPLPPTGLSESIWPVAAANNLLLAVGETVADGKNDMPMPAAWQQKYDHSRHLAAHTRLFVTEVLPAFAQAGLPVLTIKSFLPFPYADSNIDVVAVDRERFSAYEAVITRLGYRRRHNLADLREPDKQMYDYPDGQMSAPHPWLHLHRFLSWNGIVYLDLPTVWRRHQTIYITDVPVPTPAAEDELLIMAAHAFFENKYMTLHELLYLYYLVQSDIDWPALWVAADALGWRKALVQFLAVARSLAAPLALPLSLPSSLPHVTVNLSLPYILPPRQTFAAAWRKLVWSVQNGRWRELPRQLLSYTFVDGVWMYRKAYQRMARIR